MKTFKVIVAGNYQTGKTLFLRSWTKSGTDTPLTPTVTTDLFCYSTTINDCPCRFQIWDTAGQEAYHSITAPYFRSCKGVFLVFDLTDRSSFEALDYWLQMIRDNASITPITVIIGNKKDLPNIEVQTEDIVKFCKERNLVFFLVSALTGENIQMATEYMIKNLFQQSGRLSPDVKPSLIQVETDKKKKRCFCI